MTFFDSSANSFETLDQISPEIDIETIFNETCNAYQPNEETSAFPWWVIVASAAGGLFVLITIITIFVCCCKYICCPIRQRRRNQKNSQRVIQIREDFENYKIKHETNKTAMYKKPKKTKVLLPIPKNVSPQPIKQESIKLPKKEIRKSFSHLSNNEQLISSQTPSKRFSKSLSLNQIQNLHTVPSQQQYRNSEANSSISRYDTLIAPYEQDPDITHTESRYNILQTSNTKRSNQQNQNSNQNQNYPQRSNSVSPQSKQQLQTYKSQSGDDDFLFASMTSKRLKNSQRGLLRLQTNNNSNEQDSGNPQSDSRTNVSQQGTTDLTKRSGQQVQNSSPKSNASPPSYQGRPKSQISSQLHKLNTVASQQQYNLSDANASISRHDTLFDPYEDNGASHNDSKFNFSQAGISDFTKRSSQQNYTQRQDSISPQIKQQLQTYKSQSGDDDFLFASLTQKRQSSSRHDILQIPYEQDGPITRADSKLNVQQAGISDTTKRSSQQNNSNKGNPNKPNGPSYKGNPNQSSYKGNPKQQNQQQQLPPLPYPDPNFSLSRHDTVLVPYEDTGITKSDSKFNIQQQGGSSDPSRQSSQWNYNQPSQFSTLPRQQLSSQQSQSGDDFLFGSMTSKRMNNLKDILKRAQSQIEECGEINNNSYVESLDEDPYQEQDIDIENESLPDFTAGNNIPMTNVFAQQPADNQQQQQQQQQSHYQPGANQRNKSPLPQKTEGNESPKSPKLPKDNQDSKDSKDIKFDIDQLLNDSQASFTAPVAKKPANQPSASKMRQLNPPFLNQSNYKNRSLNPHQSVVSKAKANSNTKSLNLFFNLKNSSILVFPLQKYINMESGYGSKVGGSSFGPNPGIDRDKYDFVEIRNLANEFQTGDVGKKIKAIQQLLEYIEKFKELLIKLNELTSLRNDLINELKSNPSTELKV
ncbi:MAG: hypothetical protein EZS28_015550 [Streblomastix strix]|uniref:Uncharacterized protein n=1 Tax=Streblomastix strix TaxID=222440 RepID=A0A5J4W1S4_9EUKA|nr:MAG: hypothetical protein EZS28_015550 [Streblomastix strix]